MALYARVSTMDQSTGLESQMRVLRTYCEGNQITNYEFFSDEGISGTKSNRLGLDRLMAAVESGEISSVVVFSFCKEHNPSLECPSSFQEERRPFRQPHGEDRHKQCCGSCHLFNFGSDFTIGT